MRGAHGLGEPEVRAGARGYVRLAGVLPVPVRILAVDPGRAWEWQVGPVRMRHRVDAGQVAIEITARGPIETAVALAYGPVITLMLHNLSRVAAGEG